MTKVYFPELCSVRPERPDADYYKGLAELLAYSCNHAGLRGEKISNIIIHEKPPNPDDPLDNWAIKVVAEMENTNDH